MISFRTVRNYHLNPRLKLQTPSLSLVAHFQHQESETSQKKSPKTEQRLSVRFRQAVGLSGRGRSNESETDSEFENAELKKRLKKLEGEVRGLYEEKPRETLKINTSLVDGVLEHEVNPSLYAVFTNNDVKKNKMPGQVNAHRTEDPRVYKKLSPDMEMFVYHLYKEGYFKDSNLLPKKEFDLTCFENSYAREFIKYAAVNFGKDNQEIAKWLSGSALKKVALFGCPSLGKKTVFSAKRLRTFFGIEENIVCRKCPLKMSCKLVNQSVMKGDTKNLQMANVMRVIIMYALESVPEELTVPEEIKNSVSQLLKEIVSLS